MSKRQNISEQTEINEPNIRKNLNVQLYNHKRQDVEFFSSADNFQSSNTSDNEYIMSDLSDTTDIDANEYIEYDHLFSGKSKDSKDIY
ncbi:14708_t:CDS:2 [Cetraspora pellucida]|uniref:14708_t:CDS:1 n=1 Tax=Cetraspora pellucida TaxID=1433469 RepID=A0A9N9D851_9GLOM|nr:14708_t:CDS:2 [Cetraspora pellucida]